MTINRADRLAYSTLACPGWSLERAIEVAHENGYSGLELRLVDGQMISADMMREERSRIGRVLDDSGLDLVSVDSSIRLSDWMSI